MGEPNLHEVHDFLVNLAKEAGEMIVAANPSTMTADSKKNCRQCAPLRAIGNRKMLI